MSVNIIKQELKELIAHNDIAAVFNKVEKELDVSAKIYDDFLQQKSWYNRIVKSNQSGILSNQELQQDLNKININLINLTNEIKESHLIKNKKSDTKSDIKKNKLDNEKKINPLLKIIGVVAIFIFGYFILNSIQSSNNDISKPTIENKNDIPSEGIYWKKNSTEDTYYFYIDGVAVTGLKALNAVNDQLVYDPKTRATYLQKNYKTVKGNTLYEAKIIGTGKSIFWIKYADKNTYDLFVDGDALTGLSAIMSGNDQLVTNPRTNTTYLLPNYLNAKSHKLYEGYLKK